jgi:hypothetical protein
MAEAEREDKGWCILELMGHRKLAGYVSDDGGLVRIDVYLEDPERLVEDHVERTGAQPIATQWYGTGAIYCVTATTVELAIQVAKGNQPKPVGRWELPPPAARSDEESEVEGAYDAAWDDEQ